MKRAATLTAADYWADPEFWPPKGLGCSWCHLRPAVVKTQAWGMQAGGNQGGICEQCLMGRMGFATRHAMFDWLIAQSTSHERAVKRVAALEAWRSGHGGLHLVRAYEAKYGVDLTRG